MTEPARPDRLKSAATTPFDSSSLVGSFFHGRATPGWQGCVVAEPSPGVFLVELFSWMGGHSTEQQLVPLAEMHGWVFYDTAEWMNEQYEHSVSARWERERKEARGD